MPLREHEASMAAEATRNRLLRRVDWRFLLPNPRPERSICFSGGELAEAVAAISTYSTCGATPALLAAEWNEETLSGSYDLAVTSDPDPETLAAAWEALRPGGVCYSEWNRPGVAQVRRAKYALQMAGFDLVRSYWPWPWPAAAAPNVWVPTGAEGGLRVWRALRAQKATIAQQLVQNVQWMALQLALKWDVLPRITTIAYKPVPGASGPATIASEALRWTAEREEAPTWEADCLLLTGGMRSINKVVAIIVGPQGEGHSVVKLARVPESDQALRREATTLTTIHAAVAGGLAGAPQVLFCHNWHNGVALGESLHIGQPLWQRLTADNYQIWAFKAADWLAQLAANQPPVPRRVWWERLIGTRLAEFATAFDDVASVGLVDWCREALAKLGDLPLVCEQRDFAPWNVLAGGDDQLIVLDWESAELQGLPGTDLIYFLTHLAFFRCAVPIHRGAVDINGARTTYRTTWNPETELGRMTQAAFARYTAQCELDNREAQALRVLTWLIHSASEVEHLVADANGAWPAAQARKNCLFLGLLEEEFRLYWPEDKTL